MSKVCVMLPVVGIGGSHKGGGVDYWQVKSSNEKSGGYLGIRESKHRVRSLQQAESWSLSGIWNFDSRTRMEFGGSKARS